MTLSNSSAPDRCPNCDAVKPFRLSGGVISCVWCGYVARPEPPAQAAPTDEELDALFGDGGGGSAEPLTAVDELLTQRRERYRPSYIIKHKGGVSAHAEAIFSTAMDHVRRKDWEGAIRHLYRAIDNEPEFTDAHLWLSRLLADESERRKHLKALLAVDMQHSEGLRELMILDGELDADDVVDDFTMPDVAQVDSVEAKAQAARCPRCGAPKLTHDPDRPGVLRCGSCGHTIANRRDGAAHNMARAMLKKRAQPVVWVVDQRVLHCNGCGAERTLPAQQLSESCPFCGSRNVITQDAVGSLSQPDVVVPFHFDEARARELIADSLDGRMERLKALFSDRRTDRISVESVYLPYWVFDAAVDVTRSYRIRDDSNAAVSPLSAGGLGQILTEQFPDAALSVPIPAISQPPAWMLARLGKFELSGALAYSPEVIAQHSAEIYTMDFDAASLEAYAVVGQAMREKHNIDTSTEVTLSVSTVMRPISFRLALLPVWAVSIYERDGDMRPALINGQSGKVVLGKAAKNGKKAM
ncbi:MAG: hypothetical protein J5J04_00550 [Anaerolineae bacterium]|jgi:ribosomal protein L37AE/L43A|nr:hypothetical protein [Anaerolineae bacterium]GIK29039.1 MAG: hypothetical protein BroJett007_21770 [Chloroflexota bacterium]